MIRLSSLTKLIRTLGYSDALPAFAAAGVATDANVGVLRCEFVPMNAMGLACVCGNGTDSSQNVDLGGYDFNMIRIHAIPIPAKMVAVHPFGNRAMFLLKVKTMGRHFSPIDVNKSIPILVGCQSPRPARRHVPTIFDDISKWLPAMVIGKKPIWFTFHMPLYGVTSRSDARLLTTPAMAVSEGNIWSRIRMHFWSLLQRFRGAVAGGVSAPPGFSLPSFYHFSPCLWGFCRETL